MESHYIVRVYIIPFRTLLSLNCNMPRKSAVHKLHTCSLVLETKPRWMIFTSGSAGNDPVNRSPPMIRYEFSCAMQRQSRFSFSLSENTCTKNKPIRKRKAIGLILRTRLRGSFSRPVRKILNQRTFKRRWCWRFRDYFPSKLYRQTASHWLDRLEFSVNYNVILHPATW